MACLQQLANGFALPTWPHAGKKGSKAGGKKKKAGPPPLSPEQEQLLVHSTACLKFMTAASSSDAARVVLAGAAGPLVALLDSQRLPLRRNAKVGGQWSVGTGHWAVGCGHWALGSSARQDGDKGPPCQPASFVVSAFRHPADTALTSSLYCTNTPCCSRC
jgi:hypothetical protein